MKPKLSSLKVEIINTIFIFVLGVLLHFTYEWSNHNIFVAFFSPVNESTWEHLKLVFFPMAFTSIIASFYFKEEISNYLCIKIKGIFLALLFLVVFFYLYTGILGKSIGIINIGSFFVSVLVGQIFAYKKRNTICSKHFYWQFFPCLALFIIFTFFPPHIGLFKDPITGGYGLEILTKH